MFGSIDIDIALGSEGCPHLPTRGYDGDAGWDLYTSRTTILPPDGTTDIHTDISVAIPPRWYGHIHARSSTYSKHGIIVLGGIIDSGYRGELFILGYNPGPAQIVVDVGIRLAQVIFYPIPAVRWTEVPVLPVGDRGVGAFGSTGR